MFRTVFTNDVDIVSNSGSFDRPDYCFRYIDDGTFDLVPSGVIHSYDDIQSYLPATDMHMIMEHYLKTGDSSGLCQRNGFYEDITELPSSYVEMANMLSDCDKQFWSLPSDIRDLFEQNPAKFYSNPKATKSILDSHFNNVSRETSESEVIANEE